MEINALSAISDIGSKSETKNKDIAGDFNTFLTLLTTQLQNQNPLEPLDTNQFTAQLVQFAGVEQSIKTNDNLERLTALSSASTITSAVGFIGKVVTAAGDTTQLVNDTAAWSYTSPTESPETKVSIYDQFGTLVFQEDTTLKEGTNTLFWDGKRSDGSKAPAGSYRISIDAKDAEGKSIKVDTAIAGIVEGVDVTDSEPFLTINGSSIRFSAVRTVLDAPE